MLKKDAGMRQMTNSANIDVQPEIIKLLLEEGEDTSVREVARRLKISSALAHYHMKKLSEMGVLIHRATSPKAGYYELQPIFTADQKDTAVLLSRISKKVKDCTPDKLGNCVKFFLNASSNTLGDHSLSK